MVASSKFARKTFQREMQITLNRRARTLVTSRAGDALIRGTISSTVVATILARRLYPGAIVHNAPPRNQQCCPLRKSHYRACTRARAYAMLSRSARCALHCVAMIKQMRVSAPFIEQELPYRSQVAILKSICVAVTRDDEIISYRFMRDRTVLCIRN